MTRRRRRAYVVVCVLVPLVLLVAAAAYIRVGWWRMEAACSVAPPGYDGSVGFGWSWSPPGFTCTYDDGHVERSLWF